jgi:ribonuclease D
MWRKQKAAELQLDPVAIVSSEDLHAVARLAVKKNPDPLKEMSAFKRERHGAEILKILPR